MSESTPALDECKTCAKCQQVRLLTEFSRRADNGRYKSYCNPCINAQRRQRYADDPEFRARLRAATDAWDSRNADRRAERYWQNREQRVAASREYYQRNREKLAADARERSRRNPDPGRARNREWRLANRDRQREIERAWRAANPERAAEKSRRQSARRRARLQGLPAEQYTMAQLIERDGTACVLCGEDLDLTAVCPHPMAPTVEHLEPISWGPGRSAGDVPLNCAVAHHTCNVRRQDRPHPAAARKRAELLASG